MRILSAFLLSMIFLTNYVYAQQISGKQLQAGAATTNLGISSFARKGNTNTYATTSGAFTNGHCLQADSNSNIVDSGSTCGAGGGAGTVNAGTTGTLAQYLANGTTVDPLTLGTGILSALGTNINNNSGFITFDSSGNLFGQSTLILPTGSGAFAGFGLKFASGWKYTANDYGYALRHAGSTFTLLGAPSGTADGAATTTVIGTWNSTGDYTAAGSLFATNNLAVGTTSPDYALTVVNASNQGIHVRSTDSDAGWGFSSDTTNGRLIINQPGGSERVSVLTNGNVGIGNTSPSEKLVVTGNINISGNAVVGSNITAGNITANNITANTYLFGALGTAGVAASNQGWFSLSTYGAKCDGSTDDTLAIQNWAAEFASGVTLVAPPGVCIFKDTIQFGSQGNGGDLGASVMGSGLGTVFRYTGTSTTKDLFVFGYPASGNNTFGPEVDQATITNIKISSTTNMTAGSAIVLFKFGRGSLNNVYADGQDSGTGHHYLFNGFLCAGCNDITLLNSAAEVKNDAVISYSITPTGHDVDGCYCGVVYISGGKYSSSNVGIHLTAKASVTFDNGEIIGNNYNISVDQVDVTACNCAENPGNQGFFLGTNGFVDSAQIENIRINDGGSSGGNKLIQLFGNVSSILTGSGSNINVVAWNNNGQHAQISIATGQISGARGDGIRVQDNQTILSVASNVQLASNGLAGSGYGVNCTVVSSNIHVAAQMYENVSGNFSSNCANNTTVIGYIRGGKSGNISLGGTITAADVGPDFALYDTSQSANNHYWDMYANGSLQFRALNDAYSSSVIALALGRTGTVTAPNLPTSAGSGGLYVCIDSSGNMYKKSSCP